MTSFVAKCGLSLALLLSTVQLLAQMRNAHWFLGNSWVTFQGGTPALIDAPIPGSIRATLSNTSGDLRVYYRHFWPSAICGSDHQPIFNHPELVGSNGQDQSAVFVPKPEDPESCYLLLWNRLAETEEWRWGILEIHLGPLGTQPTAIGTDFQWFMTDALYKSMVVPHANGVDYWFVTQERGSFMHHAYLITADGIIVPPVIGQVGAAAESQQQYGILVPSLSGQRFISTNQYYALVPDAPSVIGLYSFDPATGAIGYDLTIPELFRVKGAEFSPSDRYLYLADRRTVGSPGVSWRLFQYDLQAQDPIGARELVDSIAFGPSYTGTTSVLHMAPDGRIYMAFETQITHLGVITSPDEAGADCNYVDLGFQCLDQVLSLPSFAKRYHDDPGPSWVSISEVSRGDEVRVVPNPMEGTGALWWPAAQGAVELVWSDLRGREVRRERGPIIGGRVALNAAGLAPGTYMLRCRAEARRQVVLRVAVVR